MNTRQQTKNLTAQTVNPVRMTTNASNVTARLPSNQESKNFQLQESQGHQFLGQKRYAEEQRYKHFEFELILLEKIAEQKKELSQKDKELTLKEEKLVDLEEKLTKQREELTLKEEKINNQNAAYAYLETQQRSTLLLATQKEEKLIDLQEEMEQLKYEISQKDDKLEEMKEELAEKDLRFDSFRNGLLSILKVKKE